MQRPSSSGIAHACDTSGHNWGEFQKKVSLEVISLSSQLEGKQLDGAEHIASQRSFWLDNNRLNTIQASLKFFVIG